MESISGAKITEAHQVTLINKAIDDLNVNFMRDILKALYHVPAAREAIQKKLLTTADKAVPEQTESEDEDLNSDASEASDEESEIQALTDEDEASSEGDGSEDEKEEVVVTTKKRKASTHEAEARPNHVIQRWVECGNCKKLFDVTANEKRACTWHPDIKTADYESSMWDDHDEDCHGTYESFMDDEDYAEGFIWQCCERNGNSKGCKRGMHRASVQVNKRVRY